MRFAAVVVLVGVLLVPACGEGGEGPEGTAVSSPTVQTASPTATRTVVPATPMATPEARVPIGKIAFSSRRDGNGEIYLLTAESETNLTNNPAEDIESNLSPDGKKVVFSSDREGNTYHLYVMNVEGGGLKRLTDGLAGDLSPRWSPDGKQIAFSRGGTIMVMDSDGSNVRQVTEPQSEATAPPCEAGGFLGGWSPDGKQLTFYAASVTEGLGQICIINVDGSGLTVVASEPPGYHVEPSWSPDGEWIAYRFIQGDDYEIYIVKPDGSSRTDLTNHPAKDVEPDWSPDGEWIVFASDRTGFFDLYMMKADGSGAALRLTTSAGKDSDPSWSR
jgi:Tol biopolymer transport system component